MKVLDTYAGKGDLTPAKLAGWDMVILDLTFPDWAKRNALIAGEAGTWVGFYSSDRDGKPMTWNQTIETLMNIGGIVGAGGVAYPVGIDWYEFAVKNGTTPDDAARQTLAGIRAAHADGIKVGPYGASLNAWPYYDVTGVTAAADWRWVADPRGKPRHACDLHQTGAAWADGQIIGDANTSDLTLAEFLKLSTGPYGDPDPPGGDDLTPEQSQQLSDLHALMVQKAKRHGIYDGGSKGWIDRLARAEAEGERHAVASPGSIAVPNDRATPMIEPWVNG